MVDHYQPNTQRGCSFFYGADAVNNFFSENNLISLIRGHEVQLEGYKFNYWMNKKFPQVITIFSAPNYCDSYNNKGAIIKFTVG
jgi:serine/threonine-protein phosphatase 2B catalytic subunit